MFAGLLARDADEKRGILTEYGTPETQAKCAAVVKHHMEEALRGKGK